MNQPLLAPLAWTIALLLSGAAAGMFVMDFLGYFPVVSQLSAPAAIELHQLSVPVRRLVFRVAIGASALSGLLLALFFSAGLPRALLYASIVCHVALVLYTNDMLVPLNREIATWVSVSPPQDWSVVFSRMIALERLRSFVPALAFALEIIAFVSLPRSAARASSASRSAVHRGNG